MGKIPANQKIHEPERFVVANPEGKSIIEINLSTEFKTLSQTDTYYSLIDKKPFLRFDQDCPTCSCLLYSGYADRRTIEKWLREIREDTQDIKAFDEKLIKTFGPIIDLFEPGLFVVNIIEHQPTDGGKNASFFHEALTNLGIDNRENFFATADGDTATLVWNERKRLSQPRFFWNQFGKRYKPASLLDGSDGTRSVYLYPTQPKSLLQEKTVERYIDMIQEGMQPFGVAYYFSGRMSLLLDGHHKAMAYYRLQLPIPCLTFLNLFPGEILSERAAIRYYYRGRLILKKEEIPEKILEEHIIRLTNRDGWENDRKIPLDVAKQYNELLKTND